MRNAQNWRVHNIMEKVAKVILEQLEHTGTLAIADCIIMYSNLPSTFVIKHILFNNPDNATIRLFFVHKFIFNCKKRFKIIRIVLFLKCNSIIWLWKNNHCHHADCNPFLGVSFALSLRASFPHYLFSALVSSRPLLFLNLSVTQHPFSQFHSIYDAIRSKSFARSAIVRE